MKSLPVTTPASQERLQSIYESLPDALWSVELPSQRIAYISPGNGPEGEVMVTVTFNMAEAHMFGSPNDEAFDGHPLARRGLEPYGAFEIEHSSWIRQLEQMNSVHPHHSPELFEGLRHYVLSFHDTTFECVAEGFVYATEPLPAFTPRSASTFRTTGSFSTTATCLAPRCAARARLAAARALTDLSACRASSESRIVRPTRVPSRPSTKWGGKRKRLSVLLGSGARAGGFDSATSVPAAVPAAAGEGPVGSSTQRSSAQR
jgi:hypothetical protein